VQREVDALLAGREHELSASATVPQPGRGGAARLARAAEHERYFRTLLGDIEEPSAPFGISDALRSGHGVIEADLRLSDGVAAQLRAQARRLGVSVATFVTWAWGQVIARTSGREQVVFGTVLFGRMHATGADRAIGLYLNTLPIRLDLGRALGRGDGAADASDARGVDGARARAAVARAAM